MLCKWQNNRKSASWRGNRIPSTKSNMATNSIGRRSIVRCSHSHVWQSGSRTWRRSSCKAFSPSRSHAKAWGATCRSIDWNFKNNITWQLPATFVTTTIRKTSKMSACCSSRRCGSMVSPVSPSRKSSSCSCRATECRQAGGPTASD